MNTTAQSETNPSNNHNSISRAMVTRSDSQNYGEYLYERDKKLREERDRQIRAIQNEMVQRERSRCSFQPSLNDSFNKRILQAAQNSQNQSMHTKSMSRMQGEYARKYSFRPNINHNYRSTLNFAQRQEFFKNLYQQKKMNLTNYFLNNRVDEQGNELFKPKLIAKQFYHNIMMNNNLELSEDNRDDNNMNNMDNKENKGADIFNKNYNYFKKYSMNRENLFQKFYGRNSGECTLLTKNKNEKIISNAYSTAFSNLFKDLDNDSDNLITYINVSTAKIPPQIKRIIDPLLRELKEDNQCLSEAEFSDAMTKLFQEVPSVDRRVLLSYYSDRCYRRSRSSKGSLKKIGECFPSRLSHHSLNNTLVENSFFSNTNFMNRTMKSHNHNKLSFTNANSNTFLSSNNTLMSNDLSSFRNHLLSTGNVVNNENINRTNISGKGQKKKNIRNKMAMRHDQKMLKLLSQYSGKGKDESEKCFDRAGRGNTQGIATFVSVNGFSDISNCTYNNYLKSLN